MKFFAIFFSNLDEFFMVRVSALHEKHASLAIDNSPDGLTPGQQLSKIGVETRTHLTEAASLFADVLVPALKENGIHLRRWEDLDDDARRLAYDYFRETVFPVLTPLGRLRG